MNNRYFVSMYTDGPATRWNVVDRHTQEWVQRFSSEEEAKNFADRNNGLVFENDLEPLDEGIEILNKLIENIREKGNYSPETTILFLDQALQCFRDGQIPRPRCTLTSGERRD